MKISTVPFSPCHQKVVSPCLKPVFWRVSGLCSFAALVSLSSATRAQSTQPAAPAHQGQWDGKTLLAPLETPYEDPNQEPPRFGVMSYFNQPWRAYMDTHPATRWRDILGVAIGNAGDDRTFEAQAQLLSEAGFRHVRVEIGWGHLNFDDKINPNSRARYKRILEIYKKHGLRPLFLLNAHHGIPGPLREFEVPLLADAPQGTRELKLRPEDAAKIRVGYTGARNVTEYKAAFPLITRVEADGTCHLSAPLPAERRGKIVLQELKYRPFQGTKLQDGTSTESEINETVEGWRKYALAVAELGREVLGTPTDSGFDMEVWNELTFGSDFLQINRYYDPPRQYAQEFTYRKTRAWSPRLRPDAQLEFESKGYTSLLPVTVDLFNDPARGFKNVAVNSGFSNQWPWNSGSSLWDGQNGLNKHYYTTTKRTVFSPESPFEGRHDRATVDALGQLDGQLNPGGEWHRIVPKTNFVPTFSATSPEQPHSALKTETIQRDLFPDSRRTNTPDSMGEYSRYTHNGDFRTPRYWQTEVNYDRIGLNHDLIARNGAKENDPRLLALNNHLNSKHLLRQSVFHLHKGFERLYFFSTDFNYGEIGIFPPTFFEALKAADFQITPQVRQTLPAWPRALGWMTRTLNAGEPITAPRQLRVEELIEHKPRLIFTGGGTPAHPSKHHRDFFAFLPFQLSAQKFAIPFYVVTPDAIMSYNDKKEALDPTRYDLPDQDFDVTLGNINGRGAKISAFDPLTQKSVAVQVLGSTPSTLKLRLPTTDSPRVLIVEEAQGGVQILEPKAVASGNDEITVSFRLNRPANAVRISYGRDWTNRGAQEISLRADPKKLSYSAKLPVGEADVVAVRVRVAAEGLQGVWPRWDEDPQGQIVMPDAKPRPANAPPTRPRPDFGTPTPITAPAGMALPIDLRLRGIAVRLPAGARVSGAENERTISLGTGPNAVTMRVRWIESGAANMDDFLPFQSATDTVSRRAVTLSAGTAAILSDYTLAATAYPGVTDLRRRFLQIPLGPQNRHLILLSASGTPQALTAQADVVAAIFASAQLVAG